MTCNLYHSTICSHTVLVVSKGFLEYMTIIAIDFTLDNFHVIIRDGTSLTNPTHAARSVAGYG